MTNELTETPPTMRFPESADFPTGPAIGEPLPDFTLVDQFGKTVNFTEARAGRRSLVVFQRSSLWWPYCRTQLVQLQQHLAEFQAAEIALFSILNDPQEALAEFTAEHGIAYPVLSDPGSEVIQRYGILNTLIRPDEPVYGIPFPGSYLTDRAGMVTEKIFHQRYQVRDTAESVLHRYFGADLDTGRYPSAEEGSPGVRVSAVLAAEAFTFQRRATLFVRLALDAGLHVYGSPVPEGYFATEVAVDGPDGLIVEPPALPPTRPLRIEELGETFNVFEGAVEIAVPLIANIREVERVPFDVTVSYQACDDRQCFIPQRKTLHFDVPLSGMVRGKPRT